MSWGQLWVLHSLFDSGKEEEEGGENNNHSLVIMRNFFLLSWDFCSDKEKQTTISLIYSKGSFNQVQDVGFFILSLKTGTENYFVVIKWDSFFNNDANYLKSC